MKLIGNICKIIFSISGIVIGMTLGQYICVKYGALEAILFAAALFLILILAIYVMFINDVRKGRI